MATTMPPLVIYGAGGHGLMIAEAAKAADLAVRGFIDDHHFTANHAGPILKREEVSPEQHTAIVGIGDNATRKRIQEHLVQQGWRMANVIHPRAWVSESAQLEHGVFVGANAVVNAEVRLADGVIVNTAAVVEHHCQVGAHSHIAPNATVCGSVRIGELVLIGAGAVVLPVIQIGNRSTIGAGATVIRDVGEGITVVGTPARPQGFERI